MMLNVQRIREDFPILNQKVHDKPLAYLDNGATSQKPKAVIDAIVNYYNWYNSNIHRGIHTLSEKATEAYENVRKLVEDFIHAESAEEIIFTRNATEAVNLVAYGWGRKNISAGDEILLTEMEHHSNLIPWQILAKEKKAVLRFIPITQNYTLDLNKIGDLITSKTKLVAVTQMSNVLGTINPVKKIAEMAHAAGALLLVDGSQGVPHSGINVTDVNCDFLAFTAHKMLGPTGVGILYGKKQILEEMDPFIGGGSMILEVWQDRAVWNKVPYKFEAGTPNIADVIAFGEAIKYLQNVGMVDVREHEKELTAYALKRLSEVEDLTIYGPKNPELQGGMVSFNFKDIHPHDVGTIVDQEGVAIRAGHHCCQPLMRKLGIPGTARASFYIYNTKGEIDQLAFALNKVKGVFTRVSH
ncbi:MAG: cysteine desulfurase [Thermodesulfobacteriota bacterium]